METQENQWRGDDRSRSAREDCRLAAHISEDRRYPGTGTTRSYPYLAAVGGSQIPPEERSQRYRVVRGYGP